MNKTNQKRLEDLTIENAKIIFKNFSGKKDQWNPLGARGFSIKFEDFDQANMLAKDGWNIKAQFKKDELGNKTSEVDYYHLPCAVRYDKVPPKIYLCSSNGNLVLLGEEEIGMLDSNEFINADVIVNPSFYENKMGGKGVKAYTRSLYVTIKEDPLLKKYGR